MLCQLMETGKKTWAYYLKTLLYDIGCEDAWNQQGVGNESSFLTLAKQRLTERYEHSWSDSISTSERFEFYASFKSVHCREKYFDYPQLRCFRDIYTQFRFGISPINVHKMRYKEGITPRNLLCPACKREIEDELHVLFTCNAYNDIRREVKILDRLNQENTIDAALVMKNDNILTVKEISRYLYRIFKRRHEITARNT